MKPVCVIVEQANNRFTLFWYSAEIEPSIIDKTPDNPSKFDQIVLKSKSTKKHNLINTANMIIFEAAANSIVTDKIEPSYTSVSQKLNGVAPILNKKTVKIKKKPQKYAWL